MKVEKRDGRICEFDKTKIVNAILHAMNDVDMVNKDVANRIANEISKENVDKLSVEEIQDMVEDKLMNTRMKKVARSYMRYRYDREKVREYKSDFMKSVFTKLKASDVQNQNANVDEHSFGGRIGEAASELTRKIALDSCVSEMAKNNHINNEIYIHDLDSYVVGMHNCLSIPFDKLLANGFNTRQTDVRPANSINTAFQLVAVIMQIQSLNQFGGVSATHLDWTMVPYVRKSFRKHYIDGLKYLHDIHDEDLFNHIPVDAGIEDEEYKIYSKAYQYAMDMTVKETYQAVEGMYHNLNTLQSRSGNQLPFTSINFGTCTKPEGRLVIRAILETSIKGNGKLHKTSIFPCTIFQCMKGVNRKEGEPNYDLFQLALRSTSQRLYPNYANADLSMQSEWVEYDRRCKQEVIDNLSEKEYAQLINKLEDQPELKDILMLEVVEV